MTHSRERATHVHTKTRAQVFMTVLFTMDKRLKKPQCPPWADGDERVFQPYLPHRGHLCGSAGHEAEDSPCRMVVVAWFPTKDIPGKATFTEVGKRVVARDGRFQCGRERPPRGLLATMECSVSWFWWLDTWICVRHVHPAACDGFDCGPAQICKLYTTWQKWHTDLILAHQLSLVGAYVTCSPRQFVVFQCGPGKPRGGTPLIYIHMIKWHRNTHTLSSASKNRELWIK